METGLDRQTYGQRHRQTNNVSLATTEPAEPRATREYHEPIRRDRCTSLRGQQYETSWLLLQSLASEQLLLTQPNTVLTYKILKLFRFSDAPSLSNSQQNRSITAVTW